MPRRFDLVVLGTGAGASTVARKCRQAGWSVAIVDSRPYGGTCALRGCDPKKVLVGAAEAVDAARRLAGNGVSAAQLRIEWPELMRFKRSFTEPVPATRERSFSEAGIETLHGTAKFVGPTSVEVDGETVEARHVHIATGATPAPLPIAGAELVTISDEFLELDQLPRRIVFLGSGFISFELGHAAAIAGAQVTMLEMADRPLANFDADLVSVLSERTRRMGIDLRLSTRVIAISRHKGHLRVETIAGGCTEMFEADLVVHGAGRVPDVERLGLDAANVAFDRKRGVLVNEFMQSVSNPAVYAAGDAAEGGLPLTPVAAFEAHIAAANLLGEKRRAIEYPPIPSVVFTLPPLASVGMTEAEAKISGLRFRTEYARTESWFSSRRLGEAYSAHKVLVDQETDRILGAHLLGPGAAESINLFALAIRSGLTTRDIRKTIFAYPTHGSDLPYML